MFFKFALGLISMIAAVVVHDGGILEEKSGVIYQVERNRQHFFRVRRANPLTSYYNVSFIECSEANCRNNFYGDRKAQKKCDDANVDKTAEIFRLLMEETYTSRLKEIQREATLMAKRSKRDLHAGATLVVGLARMFLESYNSYKIKKTNRLALRNEKNIELLHEALKKNTEAIQVEIRQLYSYVDDIGKIVCQTRAELQYELARTRVEGIIDDFLRQIELEASDLIKGNLPSTMEYLRIYSTACRASCADLLKEECGNYCNELVRAMPESTRPRFAAVKIIDGAFEFLFSMQFPTLSKPATTRNFLKSFGMIRKGENGLNTLVRAQVSPYTTRIGNITYDVEISYCDTVGEQVALCRSDSLQWSCLNKPSTCEVIVTETASSCSFALCEAGTAIYASSPATFRQKNSKDQFVSEQLKFEGFRYFNAEQNYGEVLCPTANDIQIITLSQSALLTNSTVDIRAIPGAHLFQFSELDNKDVYNVSVNFEEIAELTSEFEELERVGVITVITIAVSVVGLAFIIFLYAKRRTHYLKEKAGDLLSELNTLRPVGFSKQRRIGY